MLYIYLLKITFKYMKMEQTNIRLPKELKDFAKRLSYEQNGTLSISNGVRIALQKALKDEK